MQSEEVCLEVIPPAVGVFNQVLRAVVFQMYRQMWAQSLLLLYAFGFETTVLGTR